MKFQIKYLYYFLGLLAVGTIAYILVSREMDTQNQSRMPDDEIHRNLNNQQMRQIDKEILARIDSLKKVVNDNPKDTIALNHLGFFLLESHKFDEAEFYFDKLIKLRPERIDILNILAEMNFNLQKYDKSENYLKKIIEIDKKNEVAEYNLGVVYLMQGKKDDAKNVWNGLIKKYPDSEIARLAKESLQGL